MAGFGSSRPMGGYPALGALQGRMSGGFGAVRRPTNAPQAPQTNAGMSPGLRPPGMPPMGGPPGMPPMGGPPMGGMPPMQPPAGMPPLSNYGEGASNAGAAGMMFNLLPQGSEAAFGFQPPGQRIKRPGNY